MLRNETAASPERAAAALKGLRRYQEAPRPGRPAAMPVLAAHGRARLLDYGSEGAPPVLFVPSLINPPHVLDLSEGRSLLRWLAGQGARPLLLDWGSPAADERDLSIAGHVETLLVPLIDKATAACGAMPALAGYCLGGTMVLGAAMHRAPPAVALVAAPWRFAGFPDAAREGLRALWEQAAPAAERIGLMPMEVLQTAFWRLDPRRTVEKFIRFGALDPASEEAATFVTLEDWANDGPPLTRAAGRELVEDCFGADLPGTGRWQVAGAVVRPEALACPILNLVSTVDRIVPAASAAPVGERLLLGEGHVGMIVGRRAEQALWQPLARWLAKHAAS